MAGKPGHGTIGGVRAVAVNRGWRAKAVIGMVKSGRHGRLGLRKTWTGVTWQARHVAWGNAWRVFARTGSDWQAVNGIAPHGTLWQGIPIHGRRVEGTGNWIGADGETRHG